MCYINFIKSHSGILTKLLWTWHQDLTTVFLIKEGTDAAIQHLFRIQYKFVCIPYV